MTLAQVIQLTMKGSVILSVFALGLEASFNDVTGLIRKPQQLLKALIPIYIVMPLVAGILILLFSNIHPAAKIALFALSVSPIPPLLPKKQLKVGATESYVIGLLVAVSLLAVAVVPLLIELFEMAFQRPAGLSPVIVAKIVLTVVLMPLAVGIAIHYALPKIAEKVSRPLASVAFAFLVLGGLLILSKALPDIVSLMGNGTIIAIIIFVLIGLATGHYFGGPDPDDRTALALSTVSRHPGLALAIANVNFPDQKLSLAAIILYLLVNMVVTIPYLKSLKS